MLLEGIHLAQVFLERGREPEQCVVADRAVHSAEVQAIVEKLPASRITVLPDALYQSVSTLAHTTGLLLLASIDPIDAVETIPQRIDSDCLILDGIQDAGNVGSILRSAAAANIHRVYCVTGTAYAWSPKVLRAAMGAHFQLEIIEDVDPEILLEQLAVPLAMTDSHGAQAVFDVALHDPLAWVFGNEGAGVSALWQEAAAYRLAIPQPGGMESLNVAAAAAVCLFEQVRQRREYTLK
jgi:TrmH family RNA methyltransferase